MSGTFLETTLSGSLSSKVLTRRLPNAVRCNFSKNEVTPS